MSPLHAKSELTSIIAEAMVDMLPLRRSRISVERSATADVDATSQTSTQ